jgi:hypothetical protein
MRQEFASLRNGADVSVPIIGGGVDGIGLFMETAREMVKANRGSGGVDGRSLEGFAARLDPIGAVYPISKAVAAQRWRRRRPAG